MRTNIEIDGRLMAQVKRLSGMKTKREVVEYALDNLVKMLARKSLIELRGKITWQGRLTEMRKA